MDDSTFSRLLTKTQRKNAASLALDHGSRVAVIGGGPAGSFFSYFLLDMAERIGLQIHVDIFEPRDFNATGPGGCNMCGGVVKTELMMRVGADGYEEALKQPYAREMDFTGKPMKGFVYVGEKGFEIDEDLRGWIKRAYQFVSTLPTK